MKKNENTVMVIKIGNLYFSREVRMTGTRTLFRFSPHVYDAKVYWSKRRARNKADMLGGKVYTFDPINGELLGETFPKAFGG